MVQANPTGNVDSSRTHLLLGKGLHLDPPGFLDYFKMDNTLISSHEQLPSILAAEPQGAHLWEFCGPLNLWKPSRGMCNYINAP